MKKDSIQIIDMTPANIADYGVCGYKDVNKHLELQRKIDWYSKYYPKGLRIKGIVSETGGYQGMIEYIPGQYAHRPVAAKDYMFIHCLFVGFKKEYKGQGFATQLLKLCINEAKEAGMNGVAVVSRKGSFMAKRDIFIKNGFCSVDKAEPDFELLVLKFDSDRKNPSFNKLVPGEYPDGIIIFRSAQCPYSVKNVDAILKTAEKLKIKARLIEMDDAAAVQNSPCAFGTFCIVKDGKVISHHPISNTRFENIMKTEASQKH
ncbi:MAG: GNAT family N-acetyltransferase [Spirochaetes bacterium]|nr:GNAT family N-acetyltransferase [Spirochaetota bacterium]MBN2770257.1 GNAT family N-acetyltransferase [Spirochaetota bacterium]